MLGLLSYALKRLIIELCQEKSSNHEKHGWNFYSKAVFYSPYFVTLYSNYNTIVNNHYNGVNELSV